MTTIADPNVQSILRDLQNASVLDATVVGNMLQPHLLEALAIAIANGIETLAAGVNVNTNNDAQATVAALTAFANGQFGGVNANIAAAEASLRAAIAGGSAGAATDPALLDAATTAADALAALRDALTSVPPDTISAAIKGLTAALSDAASAASKQSAPLDTAFNVDTPAIQDALANVYAGLGGQWTVVIPALIQLITLVWHTVGPIAAPALIAEVLEHFPRIAARFEELTGIVGHGLADVLATVHKPMEAIIEGSAGAILGQLRDEMFNLGPVGPANVDAAAARLLAIAGGFGMASHLVAIGAETIVGAKHMGFPQLAAYLADAASFGKIAASTIGSQIDAALHSPARRRALSTFRSERPEPGEFTTMFHWRLVTSEAFSEYFAERGWSEADIANHLQSVFRTSSPRELALVFQDGEFDSAFGLDMLRRAGFSDADAPIILQGVLAQAHKTLDQGFVTAVVAGVADGVYEPDAAADYLRSIGLPEATVQRHLATAAHKQFVREHKDTATAIVDAYLLGAYTDEELTANLATVGLSQREQTHRAQVARIKRSAKLFVSASKATTASGARALKDETTAALDAFRAFQLDEAGLQTTLAAIGVDPKEVDGLVQLAVARREPTVKLGSVLAPGAQLARDQTIERKAVSEQQKKGLITQEEAAAQLAQLGLDQRAATDQASFTAATLAPSAAPAAAPSATQAARARTRELTTAAVDLFRQELIPQATLRAQLLAAGQDAANTDAIVQREVDALAARQAAKQRTSGLTAVRQQQTQVRNDALAAFRAGTLDAAGLEQTLTAAGFSATVVRATVDREQQAATKRSDAASARAAATAAHRVLTANQQAGVDAFRTGKLDDVQLGDYLVQTGTPPDLAAAIVNRELARQKAKAPTTAAVAAALSSTTG